MDTETTVNGAGESSPAPDGSALRYRCEGAGGCVKPGCEFIANGKPWTADEKVYMCPYNHWRSCRWVLQPTARPLERELAEANRVLAEQIKVRDQYRQERDEARAALGEAIIWVRNARTFRAQLGCDLSRWRRAAGMEGA